MEDSDALVIRRKQLRYRANHRGIKEMDIILGRFADTHLDDFNNRELDSFAALMDCNDRDLLQWFTVDANIPDHIDPRLFNRIKASTDTRIKSSTTRQI